MLQMMIATLREGVEAFLIVALAATYLRQTGRHALLHAVWSGAAAAVSLSIVIAVFLAALVVTPLWEGLLALIAAALVISMALYMHRVAPRLPTAIGAQLEQAAVRPGISASAGPRVAACADRSRRARRADRSANQLRLKTAR